MEQVKDRSVEFSNRFRLVNVADGSTLGIFDLDEITGEIYEVGTPLDANLFDSINADILKCVAKIKLNGTTLILEDKDGNELDTVDLSTLTFDVELENYYTKAETDALIASEKERAEATENSLAENITAGIAEAKDYTDDETRRAQMAEKVNSDLIAANSSDITELTIALADEITRAKLVEGDIIADTDDNINKCVASMELDETLYTLNLKNKNDADIGSVDLMPLASSTGSVSILYTETPELYQIVTISYAQWAEISRTPAKAVHINDNVYASNGYIYNVYNNNYIANDTNNIQLRCTYVPVNHGEVSAAVNAEKMERQAADSELSDRITTAQDTADEAESIARGRAQARVFDTKADMDLWLADSTHTALLNVGDNLYIKDTGVPDYWWNGESASPLEAEKPDLTEYYTKTQTDGKISTAKTEANAYTDTQIAAETAAREALSEELTAELQTANTQINQNSANIDSIYEEISELDTNKYQKPANGIPLSDLEQYIQDAVERAVQAYLKPDSGIPKSDLSSGVQSSLDKADTALQSYTETDPTVPAWAKNSTKPTYTKSEVGLENVDNVRQYSQSNPPPYPVTSVNGKTGVVTLSATDVSALPISGGTINDKITIERAGYPSVTLTDSTAGYKLVYELSGDSQYFVKRNVADNSNIFILNIPNITGSDTLATVKGTNRYLHNIKVSASGINFSLQLDLNNNTKITTAAALAKILYSYGCTTDTTAYSAVGNGQGASIIGVYAPSESTIGHVYRTTTADSSTLTNPTVTDTVTKI